jgi:hypothetical protein
MVQPSAGLLVLLGRTLWAQWDYCVMQPEAVLPWLSSVFRGWAVQSGRYLLCDVPRRACPVQTAGLPIGRHCTYC